MKQLDTYSDSSLVEETKILRKQENEILHELLLYLGEIDERELFRDIGYTSFYAYLTEGFGYGDGAAYRRVRGARCLRKHPELYSKLKSGELSFSALVELSKVKEAEKVQGLAKKCSGKSKQEVQQIVAEVAAPIVPEKSKESIRVVRIKDDSTFAAKVEPGYQISFQADEEFMALYLEAKAIGGGRLMREVLKKTLKEYTKRNSPKERQKRREARAKSPSVIARAKPACPAEALRRRAAIPSPQPPSGDCRAALAMTERSRHIPAPVKDAVYLRDEGRCTYQSPDGKRCSCQEHLEYDHVKPFALGGDHSEENIRLLCRAHNQLMAEQAFGVEFMKNQRVKHSDLPSQRR